MSVTSANPTRRTKAPPPQEQMAAIDSSPRWRVTMARNILNVVVFTALGGVLYLGHHTDWKMPKVSALLGADAELTSDWCSEHLVPESQCVECKIELLPKQKEFGFCRKHGVAECVLCHPELAQLNVQPKPPSYDTVQALTLVARQQNNSRNMLHKRRVQFVSSESAAKSGIDIDVVQDAR